MAMFANKEVIVIGLCEHTVNGGVFLPRHRLAEYFNDDLRIFLNRLRMLFKLFTHYIYVHKKPDLR